MLTVASVSHMMNDGNCNAVWALGYAEIVAQPCATLWQKSENVKNIENSSRIRAYKPLIHPLDHISSELHGRI